MKVIKTLGYLAAFIMLMFYCGFVVMYLWNGVISTTFGIININIYQALGIDLLVSFIVYNKPKNPETDVLKIIVEAFIQTTTFLIMGMLLMLFI